jgi:hypothetical protein
MTSRVPGWLRDADRFLIETTRRIGVPGLRLSLGIIFIWFGALKVLGASPVESLVTDRSSSAAHRCQSMGRSRSWSAWGS